MSNLDRKGLLFPVALLLICISAYGILVTKLGYYFDDWPVILMIKSRLNFWEFYKFDRPFSAWTFVVTAPLLGINPFNWHIFTLLLRWLTGLGAYWTLIQLWPRKKREVVLMTCLFVVYPAFWQQSIAVAYSQHFITYLLYFISIGSMLAATGKKHRALFWSISLFTTGMHLLTMEYFWGLELLRPVLLWIVLAQNEADVKKRIKRTIKTWLPFLIIFIGVIIWRYLIVKLPEDPNSLVIFKLLSDDPISALLGLSQTIIKDVSYLLITGWYKTFQIDLIDLGVPYLVLAWLLVAIVSVLSYFFFRFRESNEEQAGNSSWTKQALLLGAIAIIAGMLPGWMVNRQITVGMYSDRIAIPALFGASIVLVSIISILINSHKNQIILVGILIGLAAGAHFRTANDYRWDWVDQQRVLWQLYWRAPTIQENTAFFSDGGLFKYTGDYPTSTALNVLYSQRMNSFEQPYWLLELDDYYKDYGVLLENTKIDINIRNIAYSGLAKDSVFLDYIKDGSCLKVYTELDADNLVMLDLFRRAAPLFNSTRIIPENSFVPDPAVFGPEPAHTWCYYFEKAELARQQAQWQTIADLGNQLMKEGYGAIRPVEWFPFIEGYVHTGNMEQAEQINFRVIEKDEEVLPQLCAVWENLAGHYPENSDKNMKISQVWQSLSCPLEIP